jgi:DNA modification methylase
MENKIIKNTVKDTKTFSIGQFLDELSFNTLKDAKKRDVTKLKNSMIKRGFSIPVFVWEKFVIDGTGRKKAVTELIAEGYTFDSIPYVELTAKDMSEAKQMALEISSQYGKITDESFKEYTLDFEVDFDTMNIQGYDKDKYAEPEEKDDDIPDVANGIPVSKLGDLYELGGHRVLCGDATNLDDITKLMGDKKADSWITDPPYNVAYEGKTKDSLTIDNDSMADDKFLQFLTDAFVNATSFLKAGGAFYIWHSDSEGFNFRTACKNAGLRIRQCLIWNKNSMVMGRQDYQWKHEPCLYGWKDGASHVWNSDRTQTTVLSFDKPVRNEKHPTMKPVELIAYQVTNNTKGEDLVLDTFLGSGTTLIASHKLGRICYGMELDPKYVDVIVSRYVEFTGNNKVKVNGQEVIWEIKK